MLVMFIYSTYFEGNFQIMRIPLLFIIAKINFLFHMLASCPIYSKQGAL